MSQADFEISIPKLILLQFCEDSKNKLHSNTSLETWLRKAVNEWVYNDELGEASWRLGRQEFIISIGSLVGVLVEEIESNPKKADLKKFLHEDTLEYIRSRLTVHQHDGVGGGLHVFPTYHLGSRHFVIMVLEPWQGGIELRWHGCFQTVQEGIIALRESGYIEASKIASLTDNEIQSAVALHFENIY